MPGRHDALQGPETPNLKISLNPSDSSSHPTMPRHLLLSLVLASGRGLVDAALPAVPDDYDVLQYIDPLIGSANGGTTPAQGRTHH
jgi:hypothetical protein